MKLHKLERTSNDFTHQSAGLLEKYLGRNAVGANGQIPFGDAAARRKGGRYPPSRDGDFTTMVQQEEFADAVTQGGHGVPLTSECSLLETLGSCSRHLPPLPPLDPLS